MEGTRKVPGRYWEGGRRTVTTHTVHGISSAPRGRYTAWEGSVCVALAGYGFLCHGHEGLCEQASVLVSASADGCSSAAERAEGACATHGAQRLGSAPRGRCTVWAVVRVRSINRRLDAGGADAACEHVRRVEHPAVAGADGRLDALVEPARARTCATHGASDQQCTEGKVHGVGVQLVGAWPGRKVARRAR